MQRHELDIFRATHAEESRRLRAKSALVEGGVSRSPVFNPVFSMRVSLPAQCTLMIDSRSHYTAFWQGWLKTESRGKSSHASSACSISSCCLVCSGMHARYTDVFNVFLSIPFWCGWCEASGNTGCELVTGQSWNNGCYGLYRWWSWLLLWIQNPRVHSSMVRAADCRSAGPWFNSGWRSWFIFMTGSDNLMNHPAQRYNTMSPIRTVITTITRKSVNIGPDYHRLKTMVKRSIEQEIRNKNFGSRIGNYEKKRRGQESGNKTACTKNSWRLLAMGNQRAVCERRQLQFPPRYQ